MVVEVNNSARGNTRSDSLDVTSLACRLSLDVFCDDESLMVRDMLQSPWFNRSVPVASSGCKVFFYLDTHGLWVGLGFMKCIVLAYNIVVPVQRLKLLDVRSNIQLLSKVTPRLGMQIPIRISDGFRADLPILHSPVDSPLLGSRDINDPIEDGMRDMHSPRAELSRQTLRRSPLGELAARERGEGCAAAQRGRGARDDEGWRMWRGGNRGEETGERCLGEVEEAGAMYILTGHQHHTTYYCTVHGKSQVGSQGTPYPFAA